MLTGEFLSATSQYSFLQVKTFFLTQMNRPAIESVNIQLRRMFAKNLRLILKPKCDLCL